MSADSLTRAVQITGIILFHSLILLCLTIIYIPFYKITRNYDREYKDIFAAKKIFCCFVMNTLIRVLYDGFPVTLGLDLSLLLFGLLSGTDILIQKIPAEFLLLLFLYNCRLAWTGAPASAVFPAVLVSGLWLVFRRLIGIAVNDVLLIGILSIYPGGWRAAGLLTSVTLILWGLTGAFCRYILQKDPRTKIPMAPVIITAYLITRLFL